TALSLPGSRAHTPPLLIPPPLVPFWGRDREKGGFFVFCAFCRGHFHLGSAMSKNSSIQREFCGAAPSPRSVAPGRNGERAGERCFQSSICFGCGPAALWLRASARVNPRVHHNWHILTAG